MQPRDNTSRVSWTLYFAGFALAGIGVAVLGYQLKWPGAVTFNVVLITLGIGFMLYALALRLHGVAQRVVAMYVATLRQSAGSIGESETENN